jgi:FrmR/RcnR family transcriptional regulator, repressor of frmRAB operon
LPWRDQQPAGGEVVEDHIRTHLVDPAKNPEALDAEAPAQLIEAVHSYFR